MSEVAKNPSVPKSFPLKGVYTLIVFLKGGTTIGVRDLGLFDFKKGYYAYTGSATGEGALSLQKRVARHLRKDKTMHWHIDFFLENKNAEIVTVITAESNRNRECQVNGAIKNLRGATIPVAGFGAADCKQRCGSHLVRLSNRRAIKEIVRLYMQLFGNEGVHFIRKGMS